MPAVDPDELDAQFSAAGVLVDVNLAFARWAPDEATPMRAVCLLQLVTRSRTGGEPQTVGVLVSTGDAHALGRLLESRAAEALMHEARGELENRGGAGDGSTG